MIFQTLLFHRSFVLVWKLFCVVFQPTWDVVGDRLLLGNKGVHLALFTLRCWLHQFPYWLSNYCCSTIWMQELFYLYALMLFTRFIFWFEGVCHSLCFTWDVSELSAIFFDKHDLVACEWAIVQEVTCVRELAHVEPTSPDIECFM